MGSNVKYLKLTIAQSVVNIFAESLHAGRCTCTTDMKHIEWDFSSKACVQRLRRLRVWGRGQNTTFLEYGHVAYHIKGNDVCSDMVANILPVYPSPDPRGQNSSF